MGYWDCAWTSCIIHHFGMAFPAMVMSWESWEWLEIVISNREPAKKEIIWVSVPVHSFWPGMQLISPTWPSENGDLV